MATGVATITLTLNNGGNSNNIVRQTFSVAVVPPPPPTLDPIANVTVPQNAGVQTITLTGITSGAPAANQVLRVSATSNNPRVILAPTIRYTSTGNTALLSFMPSGRFTGVATITVTVTSGHGSVHQQFTISVAPPISLSSSSSLAGNAAVGTNTVATLKSAAKANGQFSFQVTGLSGGKYVVQATTDLIHWTSVQTNTAPFTFQDGATAGFNQRFYRAVYLP